MGDSKQMKLKGIIFDDLVNYKMPCVTLESPYCDFKCDKECGVQVCQNGPLAKAATIEYTAKEIISAYLKDDLSQALVIQGLEPLDSRWFPELWDFLVEFRKNSADPIVIYTGFKEEEVGSIIELLQKLPKVIVKFGRYIPDQENHYDDILGVNLASPNQYARRIS